MQIDLMRAFTPDCAEETTCWMCGSWFKPSLILIYGGPHGEEMCELCFRVCHERQKMSNIPNDWPTWKEYLDYRKEFTKPLFESSEEMTQAENLGLFADFEMLAYLV